MLPRIRNFLGNTALGSVLSLSFLAGSAACVPEASSYQPDSGAPVSRVDSQVPEDYETEKPDAEVKNPCPDDDNDGFYATKNCGTEVDCDDQNSSIYPGTGELCDDVDRDCDGENYNSFGSLGEECNNGEPGECHQVGKYICSDDFLAVVCSASAVNPSSEICDGRDNDCNGEVDDDLTPPSQPCYRGRGECERVGLEYRVCQGEEGWSIDFRDCDAVPGEPSEEICDGLDNNCDGQEDEGLPLNQCFRDLDEDGFGDRNQLIMNCACREGYVPDDRDCDDRPDGEDGIWGTNDDGILINPDAPDINDGIDNDCDEIIDPFFWIDVCAGGTREEGYSCGVLRMGPAECWGSNDYEQAPRSLPREPDPEVSYWQVSCGSRHTIFLRSNRAAECYGDNSDGQCNGSPGEPPICNPCYLSGTYWQASAGRDHSALIKTDDSLRMLGSNREGQCNGQPGTECTAPPGEADGVSAGLGHTCVIWRDGSKECWGNNDYEQAPSSLSDLAAFQVSAGSRHTLFIVNGGFEGYGDNTYGQGNGSPGEPPVCNPCFIPGTFTWVSASDQHSVVVRASGRVAGLGNSDYYGPLDGLVNIIRADTASTHTGYLAGNGDLICHGNNDDGQLDVPVEHRE